ncbi:MAG: RagB/SusD family nutrient uptake outer membrane protein [Prolixibacteraceae bacterium]|jgi:hypothetical protein|nr:RagB/SusD family nutrient uptake outer membrane protein [Prolixibacteraceae bacterium]
MKVKIQVIITALLFATFLSSCNDDFLDRQIDSRLSKDRVFKSYDYVSQFLVGTYAWLPEGFMRIGTVTSLSSDPVTENAMLASASDEAEHTWEGAAIQKFNNGSWSPYSNPEDQWDFFYTGIRRVNLFLENIDQVNLDDYRLNPLPNQQTEYQNRKTDLKRWKYEARFLRAYFYFELVKRYGGVPVIRETLSLDDDLSLVKRNTIEECISFIVEECDSAAAGLNIFPGRISTDNQASGRATKGAALALKSRVLLYAASPLFLDPLATDSSKPTNQGKWQKAAAAAKAVIDLGAYSLETYAKAFNNIGSKELILPRRYGSANDIEQANYPIGYEKGKSGTTPSQNLVDSYEMANGKPIHDPESGYDPQNPYGNRDPRLLQTIIVNNSTWNKRPVELWNGGRDGKGKDQASKTGYYLKKYVVENVDLLQDKTAVHTWVLFRLAEIYLNYAEALNEYDPGNPDIAKYVNLVRKRVGMPDLSGGLSQAEMREKIQNERRVELAFEDHRFWDVRRWKIAPETLGAPIMGMDITKLDAEHFQYQKVQVENRVFMPKMYWYPIPQNELIKTDWNQNPGW